MNAMNLKVTTAVLGSISVKEHEMRIVIMNDTLCCAYACMRAWTYTITSFTSIHFFYHVKSVI